MEPEVGAYDVTFNHEGQTKSKLAIARNAESAIGVVRNSFGGAVIDEVFKIKSGEDILIDSAISIKKNDEEQGEVEAEADVSE